MVYFLLNASVNDNLFRGSEVSPSREAVSAWLERLALSPYRATWPKDEEQIDEQTGPVQA